MGKCIGTHTVRRAVERHGLRVRCDDEGHKTMKITLGEVRQLVRSMIVEAVDPKKAIMKLLQLPSGMTSYTSSETGKTSLSWSKDGGYAGEKVVTRVAIAAE